jgi:hypothetical protein
VTPAAVDWPALLHSSGLLFIDALAWSFGARAIMRALSLAGPRS